MYFNKLLIILNTMIIVLFLKFDGFSQDTLIAPTVSAAGGITQGGIYKISSVIGDPMSTSDMSGGIYSVSSGFMSAAIDVQSPIILPTTLGEQPKEQVISVNAQINDDSQIKAAKLFYREGGSTSFTSDEMQKNDNNYQGTIPAAHANSKGVEYYIYAADANGNVSFSPNSGYYSCQIIMDGQGIVRNQAQPSGNQTSSYRLISIPISASEKSPKNVLEDDLGKYDNTKWLK